MVTININGNEYTLACNLRVAYTLQGEHNHEPYTKVLSRVGDMTLEQQIDILYIAFKTANPDVAKSFTKEMFRAYIFDHDEFNATVLMQYIKKVISGILGKDLPDPDEDEGKGSPVTEGIEKN